MIRLVSESAPDVVALQEVPVWALKLLESWSRMRPFTAVTKRALLGPLARGLQRLDPMRVRSPLTGQANALLIGAGLAPLAPALEVVINRGSGRERRVCQILRAKGKEEAIAFANLHLTTRDAAAARVERDYVAELLANEDRCVVCGDFNVPGLGIESFSPPEVGIDQILVKGLDLVEGPAPWEDERRRVDDLLLSDHAPVEAVIA